jgi:hypothetical protein
MDSPASASLSAEYILGCIAVVLAAVAVIGTLFRILRKRGPYLQEFAIIAFATGAFVGGWRFIHPDAPNAESLANVGAFIMLISGLTMYMLHKRAKKSAIEQS